MKRNGILHGELSRIIAELGHGQSLVVADYGLPVPPGVRRIDLAVRPGLPPLLDVLGAIRDELTVELAFVATELTEENPAYWRQVRDLVACPVELISHEAFKTACRDSVAIVRTGEWTPYANVLLRAGVVF